LINAEGTMPALSSSPIPAVVVQLAAAADVGRVAGAGVVAALAKVPDPRAAAVCGIRSG
jgi:hypothetical protein